MNTSQLLIPPRLRVGFQNREDTYSKRLAYVIYYDTAGKIRKEASWSSWRDKKIDPVEYDNEPTEGFVLNKDVGGVRRSWSHYGRMEKVRVYDPRGFEFEITIPNLLFILREGTCHPGKGLEGKFVYAWSGNELVLLPVKSVDYEQSAGYTALQNKGLKARELVPGRTYRTRRMEDWVFLGKFDFFFTLTGPYSYKIKPGDTGVTKKLVFAKQNEGKWDLVYQNDPKALAVCVSEALADNFAELVELHTRSVRGSRISKLLLKPVGEFAPQAHRSWEWWAELQAGVFTMLRTEYSGETKPTKTNRCHDMSVLDGTLCIDSSSGHYYGKLFAYHPDHREKRYERGWGSKVEEYTPASPNPWREPTADRLFALLECGAEVEIGPYSLTKE